MRPLAEPDGHDAPGLVDELVACLTAVIDEIVVGFEGTVGEPVAALNCQTFSTWLSSGHFDGRAIIVMLDGTATAAAQPDECV